MYIIKPEGLKLHIVAKKCFKMFGVGGSLGQEHKSLYVDLMVTDNDAGAHSSETLSVVIKFIKCYSAN